MLNTFSSDLSRVLFNSHMSWTECLATCSKYTRATVTSFTDQGSMDSLITWAYNTTMDPVNNTLYPDVLGAAFWIPFRYTHLFKCLFDECFSVTILRRLSG